MDSTFYGRCHPNNIWALTGLSQCLKARINASNSLDGRKGPKRMIDDVLDSSSSALGSTTKCCKKVIDLNEVGVDSAAWQPTTPDILPQSDSTSLVMLPVRSSSATENDSLELLEIERKLSSFFPGADAAAFNQACLCATRKF